MSLSTTSKCFLYTFRDCDSTTSLGSPFQCLTPGVTWGHSLSSYHHLHGMSFNASLKSLFGSPLQRRAEGTAKCFLEHCNLKIIVFNIAFSVTHPRWAPNMVEKDLCLSRLSIYLHRGKQWWQQETTRPENKRWAAVTAHQLLRLQAFCRNCNRGEI